MPIFVNYAHVDETWVHPRLMPALFTTGADVLIDTDRFKPSRAIDADPEFKDGKVLSIKLDDTPIPPKFKGNGELGGSTLYIDLQDDSDISEWEKLIQNAGR